jgi:hypothetical protein
LKISGISQDSESSSAETYYGDKEDLEVIYEGLMVRHPTYGRGVVEALESEFGASKAIVRFESFGLRKVFSSQLNSGQSRYEYDLD